MKETLKLGAAALIGGAIMFVASPEPEVKGDAEPITIIQVDTIKELPDSTVDTTEKEVLLDEITLIDSKDIIGCSVIYGLLEIGKHCYLVNGGGGETSLKILL